MSYKKGLLVHFGGEEVGQFFWGGRGMIFIKDVRGIFPCQNVREVGFKESTFLIHFVL